MEEQANPSPSLTHRWLPWAVAACAIVLFTTTLCSWVTSNSLPVVARIAGWDPSPPLSAPLHYVVTLPIRALPAGIQPKAANVLSAILAACALGFLARSVQLLPHDRTREQRQREQSEYSFLTTPTAWVPPVFAALACGLQLTFWEHATAASSEMLDLLVFAYLIRCLLEFRVEQRESWLYRFALVYGLGITNNWALIGFFPCFLVAVVWIRGRAFFEVEFMARMAVLGICGLGLYLLLPLLAWFDDSTLRLWDYLRIELGAQKSMLFGYPKSRALLLSLTSVLPVLVMGVRWPSSFGDTSAAGAMLTNLMFRVVHGMFLAAALWVAFDPRFSPRAIGYGFPFLTFYYLGALSVGYFAGYFLLVCSEPQSSKAWRRHSPLQRLVGRSIIAAICMAAVAVPATLAARNHGYIQSCNGTTLRQFATLAAQSLPNSRSVVLSDDSYQLMTVAAGLSLLPNAPKHVLVESRSLTRPLYHRQLARRHPGVWSDGFSKWNVTETIDSESLNQLLLGLIESNQVHYAHPSFGYFFENLFARPIGLTYRLHPYTTEILPPPLSQEDVQRNQAFWQSAAPALEQVAAEVQAHVTNALIVGAWYSRALNNWGVELQRLGQIEPAGKAFTLASSLNPQNLNANVNLRFNQTLRQGRPSAVDLTQPEVAMLRTFGYGEEILTANGPFDEPEACMRIGSQFALGGNFRQALLHFERARTLAPDNLQAAFSVANMYLMGQAHDKVLELLPAIRQQHTRQLAAQTNANELIRIESLALLGKGRAQEAERLLIDAEKRYPNNDTVLDTLFYLYFGTFRFTNVLEVIDRQLKNNPNNIRALLNQGATFMQMKDYNRALDPLSQVLRNDPSNQAALRNRAIAHLHLNQLDAAQKDYESLRSRLPHSHVVYYGLGEIAYRRKSSAEAIGHYEKFLDYAPRGTPEIDTVNKRLQELRQGASAR